MINSEKVISCIRLLTDAEQIFTKHLLDYSLGIRDTIVRWSISKEEFCKEMEISQLWYDDFIKGAYNYSLIDIAHLETLRYKKLKEEKEIQAQKEAQPIDFPEYKYSKIQNEPI